MVAPLLAAASAGLWLSWAVVAGVQPDVRQLPEPREPRTTGGACCCCCCWVLFFSEVQLRDFKKQTDGRTTKKKKVETGDVSPLMDERGRGRADFNKAANNGGIQRSPPRGFNVSRVRKRRKYLCLPFETCRFYGESPVKLLRGFSRRLDSLS